MSITTDELLALDPTTMGAEDFCDALFGYLADAGQTMYDETVTQLEHGLQCAALAEQAGFDSRLQVAALLHDLGHLLLDEHDGHDDFLDEDLRHEIIGAHTVTRWFGQPVGGPVALHVPAKRYLVTVDPTYAAGLSESSVRSLEVQGGAMTEREVTDFEAQAHHRDAVKLRRWDDQGKVGGAVVPGLEHWRTAVVDCLVAAHGAQAGAR